MHNVSLFAELFALGLNPIPVIWDTERKIVSKYPLHEDDVTDGKPHLKDVERWLNNGFKNFNGIALKLYPPYGMFDFDLKNTTNKEVFDQWFKMLSAQNDEILRKICIETTRNGGYHVYIKYDKLDHKIAVAKSKEGEEVIAVYTGGLLSFCAPSPNYEIIHGDFPSLDYLTDDEFDLMLTLASEFNEEENFELGGSNIKVIDYPQEYESVCIQFDEYCTSDVFEALLNMINLYRLPDTDANRRKYSRKKYVPFLREGSAADYSAKAYFHSKRLLIFSASVRGFPNWHDSERAQDKNWSLSPSKIVFYYCKCNWIDTIELIKQICESANIQLSEQQPLLTDKVKQEDRLKFPFDVFPECVQNYIFANKGVQPEYIANFVITAAATAFGNSAYLEAMTGYTVYPVFYLAVIAPSASGKTPGMKLAYLPLKNKDTELYLHYAQRYQEYEQLLAVYEKDKKSAKKPEEPRMTQLLIKDSTIEKVLDILSVNPKGCCIYADELSGFIHRMDAYKQGDDVQKWLEMHNSDTILLQRMSRKETRVENPFCCIAGGIQPAIVDLMSKGGNEFNGFYQRFLFSYPEPENKKGWNEIQVFLPEVIERDYLTIFEEYFMSREKFKSVYRLSPAANELYSSWYAYKNTQYNKATNDHAKAVIGKYQNICLRFALLLQLMHDRLNRREVVEQVNMERAIRLTEHYLGMMNKVTKILVPQSPADKLQSPYDKIYYELAECFTLKTAVELGATYNVKEGSIKTFINRNINKLFRQFERGKYEKMY